MSASRNSTASIATASRNNNSRNNNSNKSYCKVCHDAGKLESEYTNHCVKTYDVKLGAMKVTCPTLLSLECRYCHEMGHTIKFCQVLEETKKFDAQRMRERERREHQNQAQQVQAQQVQAQRRPRNVFELLDEEQDEVQNEVVMQNEFPSLGKTSSKSNNTPLTWASKASAVADKPQPKPEPVQKQVVKNEVRPVSQNSTNWENDTDDYGEYLHASIVKYYPDRAGKIVGMLLEFDPSELYELVVNSKALRQVADEANQLLEAHDAKTQIMSNRTLAEDNDW
jgi:hypothetical protein